MQIGLSLHSAMKELSSGASFPESLDGVEIEGIRNLRGETPEVRLQFMFDDRATINSQSIYLAPRETPGSRIYPGGYQAGQFDYLLLRYVSIDTVTNFRVICFNKTVTCPSHNSQQGKNPLSLKQIQMKKSGTSST